MATVLEFKLPKKRQISALEHDLEITTSVNDLMLIIHHALDGTDNDCRPKDLVLAGKLLEELTSHIKKHDGNDYLVLSKVVSNAVVVRYPDINREVNL